MKEKMKKFVIVNRIDNEIRCLELYLPSSVIDIIYPRLERKGIITAF